MANYRIATEYEAALIGGGSSYTSNLAVTKIRAEALGCTIRLTTYTDNLLVALKDLLKIVSTSCSCNSGKCGCHGYDPGCGECYSNKTCICYSGVCSCYGYNAGCDEECHTHGSCGCNSGKCDCNDYNAGTCSKTCYSHGTCSCYSSYCSCHHQGVTCGTNCMIINCGCNNQYCTAYWWLGNYCNVCYSHLLCEGHVIYHCPSECSGDCFSHGTCTCYSGVCSCYGYNAGCDEECHTHSNCSCYSGVCSCYEYDSGCDDCYSHGSCSCYSGKCSCYGYDSGCGKCYSHTSCSCNTYCSKDCPTNYG